MKSLPILGIVLLLLGALSFVVPIPHTEDHGIKIGDAKIGIQTQDSERIPQVVSVLLVLGGVVVLAVGFKKVS